MERVNEFSASTKRQALERQKSRCASCGTTITALGRVGRSKHRFGEGVQAHHVLSIKSGGASAVENCVILCESCHYSAHEGGRYRSGTVEGIPEDYPHFNG